MGTGFTLADVQRVALRHPETFAEAVEAHLAGSRGWKRCDQIAWLSQRCVFAAERREDGRAAAWDRGKPRGEVPAVRKPREAFVGWDFRWDPVPEGEEGLDPGWPSVLDLSPERHEAMAWVIRTPAGPLPEPSRLADVPGALEAYRATVPSRGAA